MNLDEGLDECEQAVILTYLPRREEGEDTPWRRHAEAVAAAYGRVDRTEMEIRERKGKERKEEGGGKGTRVERATTSDSTRFCFRVFFFFLSSLCSSPPCSSLCLLVLSS